MGARTGSAVQNRRERGTTDDVSDHVREGADSQQSVCRADVRRSCLPRSSASHAVAQPTPAPATLRRRAAPAPATGAKPAASRRTARAQQQAPAAQQQQPAPQQAAGAGGDQPQLIFSPWVKLCNKDADPKAKRICVTVKDGRVESGLLVVSVAIIEMDGEQRRSCCA